MNIFIYLFCFYIFFFLKVSVYSSKIDCSYISKEPESVACLKRRKLHVSSSGNEEIYKTEFTYRLGDVVSGYLQTLYGGWKNLSQVYDLLWPDTIASEYLHRVNVKNDFSNKYTQYKKYSNQYDVLCGIVKEVSSKQFKNPNHHSSMGFAGDVDMTYYHHFGELQHQQHLLNDHSIRSRYFLPDINDVVVHLRLGDVVDDSDVPMKHLKAFEKSWIEKNDNKNINDSQIDTHESIYSLSDRRKIDISKLKANFLWEHGSIGSDAVNGYVKNKTYFDHLLPLLPDPNMVHQVVIVGWIHHSGRGYWGVEHHRTSLLYKKKVISFFRDKGFNVTIRGEFPPDVDFMYMAHAKYFVYSGGGFSRLSGECVHRNGGTTPMRWNGYLWKP